MKNGIYYSGKLNKIVLLSRNRHYGNLCAHTARMFPLVITKQTVLNFVSHFGARRSLADFVYIDKL